jgi:hypothetical protein
MLKRLPPHWGSCQLKEAHSGRVIRLADDFNIDYDVGKNLETDNCK